MEIERIGFLMIPIGVLIALYIVCRIANDSSWNGGYCSCGGKWHYQQAIGHQYETTYLYQCDKCGETKEFYEKYAER